MPTPSPPSRGSAPPPAQALFRPRILLDPALIALVIYIVLGAPGLAGLFGSGSGPWHSLTSSTSDDADERSTANAKANVPRSNDNVPAAEKLRSIVYPARDLSCPPGGGSAAYAVHVFSTAPLVLYLDGFLSETEVDELVQVSNPRYTPSTLFSSSNEKHDPTIRRSEKALLPRTQTVRCIEARALALQGWPTDTFIERLWTQRYNVSGHYARHYDWSAANPRARRASSFMVYLSGGQEGEDEREPLEGGGTQFPRLRHPLADMSAGDVAAADAVRRQWCRFIACPPQGKAYKGDSTTTEGVTFLPRKGSAVFWQNFDPATGRGYKETLHAGLPVTRGQKIGLNIWSWYQAGHRRPADLRDDDDPDDYAPS